MVPLIGAVLKADLQSATRVFSYLIVFYFFFQHHLFVPAQKASQPMKGSDIGLLG